MTHDHIPAFILVGIIIGYLVIAWQFRGLWTKTESKQSKAKLSLGLLIAVFVLCAISGYAPRIIEFPLVVHLATHCVLLTATWWFILTRQASKIAKALE